LLLAYKNCIGLEVSDRCVPKVMFGEVGIIMEDWREDMVPICAYLSHKTVLDERSTFNVHTGTLACDYVSGYCAYSFVKGSLRWMTELHTKVIPNREFP
jgi:hypothetical protein